MPGLLNDSSVMTCPHGGQVQIVTANTRVQAGGGFAVRSTDTFTIVGCPFVIALVPHPCTQVQWAQPAQKSRVMGDFTLTEASVGLCTAADQSVQGPVSIVSTQAQVSGL
jgi:hypothetical protein